MCNAFCKTVFYEALYCTSCCAGIDAKMIGEIVMESLARIDTVAYVRFASVYKNFQAADDFDRFVSELRPGTASDD